MTEELYDRYREALKQGHLAAIRGQPEEALALYRAAAGIAGQRALPYTAMGGLLLQLGRLDDALAAYGQALEREPHDAAALDGRARALLAAGRQAEAADAWEGLAAAQIATGERDEAPTTLGRALELDDSPARRRRHEDLLTAATSVDPADVAGAADVAAGATAPEAADGELRHAAEPAGEEAVVEAPAPPGQGAPPAEEATPVGATAEGAHPDPELLLDLAEAAGAEGATERAVAAYLAAGRSFAAQDAPDAALDACQRALTLAPDAPEVHLLLARLYLERGWRERGVETLLLVDRFVTVEGLEDVRPQVAELANAWADGDDRLVALAGSDTAARHAVPRP